jgi:transposase
LLTLSHQMATSVARRWNPIVRPFYQRLSADGKAPKGTHAAAMRKLLTMLKAIVHAGSPLRPVVAPNA